MDMTWITYARRFSAAYVEGVENFMNFIRAEYGGPKSDVLCPCSSLWIQLQDPSQLCKIIYTCMGCRSHILGGFIMVKLWTSMLLTTWKQQITILICLMHRWKRRRRWWWRSQWVWPTLKQCYEMLVHSVNFHLQKKNGGPACWNNATLLSPQEISCQYSQLWSPFFRWRHLSGWPTNHSMRCWLLSANLSQMRLSCHTPTVKWRISFVQLELDMIWSMFVRIIVFCSGRIMPT